MSPPLTITPSGVAEWIAYRGTDPADRAAVIRLHDGYVSVERELPYGSDDPEWVALFWSFQDAVTAVLLFGARLWDSIDPTPRVPRRTQPRRIAA